METHGLAAKIIAKMPKNDRNCESSAKSGYVSHTVYDHTSVLKFIERRYGLQPLTSRDAAASNMLDSFDFAQSPQAPLLLQPHTCP
jgi:phospholipase C